MLSAATHGKLCTNTVIKPLEVIRDPAEIVRFITLNQSHLIDHQLGELANAV